MQIKGLGWKIALLVVIIAAPFVLLGLVLPGAMGIAFYGVLAGTFAWMSGGPKVGVAVATALSLLGALSIVLADLPWLLAGLLLLLGIGYGIAASRGVGGAFLQLPILVPYFMMGAPPLFSDKTPEITPAYLFGLVAIVIASGVWSVFILNKIASGRGLKPKPVADRGVPLIYGTILGLISATVMLISTFHLPGTHWVWMTLTLYVLANPSELIDWSKMWHRVLGTLLGFAVVLTGATLLNAVHVPHTVISLLTMVSLWACLYWFLTKKPYWQYVMFLTMTVVLADTSGASTVTTDVERMGFTIAGALLSILAALLMNLVVYRRLRAMLPQDESTASPATS